MSALSFTLEFASTASHALSDEFITKTHAFVANSCQRIYDVPLERIAVCIHKQPNSIFFSFGQDTVNPAVICSFFSSVETTKQQNHLFSCDIGNYLEEEVAIEQQNYEIMFSDMKKENIGYDKATLLC